MRKLELTKSMWEGNRWPSVDIYPYEYEDFLPVLTHLCADFGVSLPQVIDIFDGYVTDLNIDGVEVKLHMDNWTFSVAAAMGDVRDKLFSSLERVRV